MMKLTTIIIIITISSIITIIIIIILQLINYFCMVSRTSGHMHEKILQPV